MNGCCTSERRTTLCARADAMSMASCNQSCLTFHVERRPWEPRKPAQHHQQGRTSVRFRSTQSSGNQLSLIALDSVCVFERVWETSQDNMRHLVVKRMILLGNMAFKVYVFLNGSRALPLAGSLQPPFSLAAAGGRKNFHIGLVRRARPSHGL